MATQPNAVQPVSLDFSKAQPVTQAPASDSPVSLDFSQAQSLNEGEQINDIGKTVIVPQEGESFSDTMARAVAQGKKTTQQDINDELATAPKKVATTLAAAPVIGAAGTAGLAGAGQATVAAKNYILKQLAEQSPDLFGHEAVKETLKRYALEAAKKAMTGAAWAGGAEVLHSIWSDVFGKSK